MTTQATEEAVDQLLGTVKKNQQEEVRVRPATWADLLPILVAEVGMTAVPDPAVTGDGDDDGGEDPFAGDV